MDDLLYREIILEHWKNPQNYGVLENADIDITDYNPLCGDEIQITANLSYNRGPTSIRGRTPIVKEIKFSGRGCAISQASASLLTDMVKGAPVNQFRNLLPEQFLQNLEISLSPARLKCALLAYATLQKALTNLPEKH